MVRNAKIKIALFDMAGTTVDDTVARKELGVGVPLVIAAYYVAFKTAMIDIPFNELNSCRGKSKIGVFKEKVGKYRRDLSLLERESLAQKLHDEQFIPALLENVPYIREIEGTSDAFRYLKSMGVYIATGSGFPQVITEAINKKLGWKERNLVDLLICSETVGGDRPEPHMINATLVAAGYLPQGIDLSKKIEGFDYSILLKIGDTEVDIEEGLNVGAITIGVYSGTHTKERLEKKVPLTTLPSIKNLPKYLEDNKLVSQ